MGGIEVSNGYKSGEIDLVMGAHSFKMYNDGKLTAEGAVGTTPLAEVAFVFPAGMSLGLYDIMYGKEVETMALALNPPNLLQQPTLENAMDAQPSGSREWNPVKCTSASPNCKFTPPS